jgi:hypothetical protein
MDHQFCPGAKILRQPQPEMFDCPDCGEEVEIWTDEIRGVCSNCGRAVFRDGYMSCLEWCKFAEDCIGEEAYDRYKKNRVIGLRRKLLEALHDHWGANTQRIGQAEAVLSWSEKILQTETAAWHIVIPASILHNIGGGDPEGLKAAEKILLRAGLLGEEIQEICRIIEQDPSEHSNEFNIVHDAVLLGRPEDKRPAADVLRTDTGKRLAVMSASGA